MQFPRQEATTMLQEADWHLWALWQLLPTPHHNIDKGGKDIISAYVE